MQGSDLSLFDILRYLIGKWPILIGVPLVIGALTAGITLLFPNQYKSKALLAPSDELFEVGTSQSGAGLLGSKILGLGGGATSVDPVDRAMAMLESRKFIIDFLESHNLLPELVATEAWSEDRKAYVWNDALYDSEEAKWVLDSSSKEGAKPNNSEAYRLFLSKFSAEKQFETGLVSMAFEHISPERSQEILVLLVKEINSEFAQDITERSKSKIIAFRETLSEETSREVRSAIAASIVSELQRLAMIEQSENVAFEVIDPPNYPDEKSGPFRKIIVVLSVFFSGAIVFIFFIIRIFLLDNKRNI